MSGNFPAGVTGSEAAICGTGCEDKCVMCLENADEESVILGNVPEGELDSADGLLCLDCAKLEVEENTTLLWDTLVEYITKKETKK